MQIREIILSNCRWFRGSYKPGKVKMGRVLLTCKLHPVAKIAV